MLLKQFIFLLLCDLVLCLPDATRRIRLVISANVSNPDCFNTEYPTLLVNGQFPAPPIHVLKGDLMEIYVDNQLETASTSLHFHGIRQYGSPEADGVPGVTQLPIGPGQHLLQRFRVTGQTGTYFYHAHSGMQDDFIQGPFIVHDSMDAMPPSVRGDNIRADTDVLEDGPYTYNGERNLQLTEWWHQSFVERQEYYEGPSFTFDHGSSSLLINGRTVHNTTYLDDTCHGYSTLNVQRNKVYRLRVIAGNTFRTVGLAIKDHPLTIIEVDGEMTQPYNTSYLEITPGQRFSVLINTGDAPPGTHFAIATSYRWRRRGKGYTENGLAYLRYVDDEDTSEYGTTTHTIDPSQFSSHAKVASHPDLPPFPGEDNRDWIWPELMPLGPRDPILDEEPSRIIKLKAATTKLADGRSRYTMNGRLPIDREGSALASLISLKHSVTRLSDLQADGYSPVMDTYPIFRNETIDIVFQNGHSGNQCLIHPWHTHGHSHYLIASGDGEYDHEKHKDIRNFPHPILKDVSTVYPTRDDPETGGCGWTKVRIVADNPGMWAVHCHITSHMNQGKMVVLEESADELIRRAALLGRSFS
ncbi:Cupredoxin [Radiomyces spectabilis]|uniref:Cupredoxin n=1 Tax=Radiomyces spectabilis TaxID=64574 RepID=UPI00221E5DF7|nr:Cupredoxin [Radiomyces spectabilis]KAI8384896.1 Cupredoxin [Radiomyces spectabilis]